MSRKSLLWAKRLGQRGQVIEGPPDYSHQQRILRLPIGPEMRGVIIGLDPNMKPEKVQRISKLLGGM